MEKVTIHADWQNGMMFETELNGHKLIWMLRKVMEVAIKDLDQSH